jgi:hypothetical protein
MLQEAFEFEQVVGSYRCRGRVLAAAGGKRGANQTNTAANTASEKLRTGSFKDKS